MSAAVRRPVYFDYAASTPVDPRVAALMMQCLSGAGTFGNPGSRSHEYGDAASALVETAREQVAAAVGAAPAEIVWTSGATEANNLALFGVANYYQGSGKHIVTVRTEHKSVLDPCRELERRGWRITYLVPDRGGLLDPSQVASALRSDTVLVSVMHVNNEIGVIQDIAAIAAVCAAHGTVRFHVDAAQSIGKAALDFAGMGIDLLSLSAHKAYGPKGVGALVISRARGVQLQALHFGGGQERNHRSGTVATHQVVGMGAAFALAKAEQNAEVGRIERLRDGLWSGLEALGGVQRNGGDPRVAHVLNVSFEDVEGESLLAAVRPFVALSTGAACSSAVQEPSYVLRALGRDERMAESSLRFSLGRFSTESEVDTAVRSIASAVAHLRRISGSRILPRARAHGHDPQGLTGTASPTQYNGMTWTHFQRAAAAGSLSGPDVRRGSAGDRTTGTRVQFEVQSEPNDRKRLRAVKFLAYGCPHVIAASDWVAQQGAGGEPSAALPSSVGTLQRRFAVPVEKLGRLLIVEDAWIAALSSPYP